MKVIIIRMFFFKSYFLKLTSILYLCFLVSINFFIPIATLFGDTGEEVLISSIMQNLIKI